MKRSLVMVGVLASLSALWLAVPLALFNQEGLASREVAVVGTDEADSLFGGLCIVPPPSSVDAWTDPTCCNFNIPDTCDGQPYSGSLTCSVNCTQPGYKAQPDTGFLASIGADICNATPNVPACRDTVDHTGSCTGTNISGNCYALGQQFINLCQVMVPGSVERVL